MANCVNCSSGADVVHAGKARYLSYEEASGPCVWSCLPEYYAVVIDDQLVNCLHCRDEEACELGQKWQACTQFMDAQCVDCLVLQDKGAYAVNEEYYNGTAAENGTCNKV